MQQIDRLREAGYNVRIQHYRIPAEDAELVTARRADPDFVRALYPTYALKQRGKPAWHKGGGTSVVIRIGRRVVAHGESVCNPVDPFSRKIGTEIALGRAIHNLKPAGQRRMLRQTLAAQLEKAELALGEGEGDG